MFRVGQKVAAKYRGNGTVIHPSEEMIKAPHFEDDISVQWDDGLVTWVQPSMLSLARKHEVVNV
jgi:hypothetical protein